MTERSSQPTQKALSFSLSSMLLLVALLACFITSVFVMHSRIATLEARLDSIAIPPQHDSTFRNQYMAHEVERQTTVHGYTSRVKTVTWSADKSEMAVVFSWDPGAGEKTYRIEMPLKPDGYGSYVGMLPWPASDRDPLAITIAPGAIRG